MYEPQYLLLNQIYHDKYLFPNHIFHHLLSVYLDKKNKHKFKIKIYEGKNREIRKIMNYFKLKVERLKRLEYGPFKLGELEIGKILEIKKEKVKIILKQFGISDENYFW